MTTADQLHAHVRAKTSPFTELYEKAALELDQRDDTIAQLRAERDALARERDRFREALKQAESPCTCGQGRFGILHTHDCAISLRNSALKGETSENP